MSATLTVIPRTVDWRNMERNKKIFTENSHISVGNNISNLCVDY